MSAPPVRFEVANGIARITLDRPDAGNAVDLTMARALVEVAIRCQTDASIRCVVLTGAGRIFCAGGDLTLFASAGEGMAAMLSELAGTFHMALARFADMAKPFAVLVNGPAAGAGLSLAIAGDVVFAARSAHFTAAYGALGLTPDGGMSWLLPRLVGLRRAQDMLLANRRVGAEEAEAIGLVTRLVDDDRLADEGSALAARLADAATTAIGATRRLLRESFSSDFGGQLDAEARAITAAGGSAECREGLAAYIAGRVPDFRRAR